MIAGLAVFMTALQHTAQFTFDLNFVVNKLPLWFLMFALFLPRLAMAVAWFQGMLVPYHLLGILPVLVWLLLPRLLVLYLIYVDQGIHLWFWLHLLAALLVWGGSSGYHSRRWRN